MNLTSRTVFLCTLFPYCLALLPSLGCASGCQTSNQTGNKVQRKTDKQKKGAIKCCKEISSPTLKYEWRNIPFFTCSASNDLKWPLAHHSPTIFLVTKFFLLLLNMLLPFLVVSVRCCKALPLKLPKCRPDQMLVLKFYCSILIISPHV